MIIGAMIIILTILLDQSTKYLMQHLLDPSKTQVVIPHILEFKYFENSGAAWGIFEGKQTMFLIITIIVLAILGYLFTKVDFKIKKVYTLAITFLIGGTLGNALDRMILGYVIDFIHIPFFDYLLFGNNFVFNFADLFLTFGVVLFAIDILFLEERRLLKNEDNR